MRLNIDGQIIDKHAVWWDETNKVKMIDQTKIPFFVEILTCSSYRETAEAIKNMNIRGAPAIGAAAAYGFVQALFEFWNDKNIEIKLESAYKTLLDARPTAVDLKNGLDYIRTSSPLTPDNSLERAKKFASDIAAEGEKIGQVGKELIRDGMNILTHCHTGALALVDFGSAIAPLIAAWKEGKRFHVYVDETRPRMQGKMTAWELRQYEINHTVICDSAGAYLMSQKKIDLIILGADRVALNGDIANKIGTYNLAVLAKHHRIPFYTTFPTSTFDKATVSGADIKIEERSTEEITHVTGLSLDKKEIRRVQVYDDGSKFFNPAFDITPAELITGYITPYGILTSQELKEVF